MEDDKVVQFPGMPDWITIREDRGERETLVAPDNVLSKAIEAELKQVVVVGVDSNDEMYVALSSKHVADGLFLLHKASAMILRSGS